MQQATGTTGSMDKTLIPLLYNSMEYDGERLMCPYCAGGDTGELSFTIRKADHGYLYNCFRDSCRSHNNSSGFYATSAQPSTQEPELRRKSRVREFRHETRELHASETAWLAQKYGLWYDSTRSAGIRYAPKVERFVFPIRGLHGEDRGIVARRFGITKDKKKAIAYPFSDTSPFVHWALADCNLVVVIVEDFLSALRVQQLGYTALALLGTHMPADVLAELIKYGPHDVVVALDPDAIDKAFKLRNHLKLYFPKVRVAFLEQDIKDTRLDEDIRKALALL